ncbi:MAG: hypothetical protein JST70_15795 [Bacteroidetes bacterium]|nr:hypothetical protein [Bacteroidota bacterium]
MQNGDAGMSKDDFVNSIYSAAIIVNALGYEIRESHLQPSDVNIAGLLSCDEVAWMDYMNSAKDYLVKGPGIDANGIQVRNAVPLLVDFINSTDIAIEHQEYSAVLRFAHAETISPFAAL